MTVDSSTPILVVDDEWMMVEIITSLLKKLTFSDVDFAADAESALTLMRQKAYGLVISDLNMGGMGGLKFLKQVRSDPALRNTPFIMTTASQSIENAVAAKHAGVDNYLLKPFSLQALGRKVEVVLAKAQASDGAQRGDEESQTSATMESIAAPQRASWHRP